MDYMKMVFVVQHTKDVETRSGDVITITEDVAFFTTYEEAKRFVEENQAPHVYAEHPERECGMLIVHPITVFRTAEEADRGTNRWWKRDAERKERDESEDKD